MASAPQTRRLVIVEARDLDTDDRDRRELTVEVPREPASQREQLAGIVAEIHPAAKLRSFADGAATFLGPSHLVVAHYGDQLEAAASTSPSSSQPSLFAA